MTPAHGERKFRHYLAHGFSCLRYFPQAIPEMNIWLCQMEGTECASQYTRGWSTWKEVTMGQLDKVFLREQ